MNSSSADTTTESRSAAARDVLARWVPALTWLPRYRRDQLPGDLVAGSVVAVLLVPQSMAYAVLAGLPPQVGLYASILPLIIYALLGTSRALGVGPTAIASLMTASGVSAVAAQGTEEYIGLAILLTFLVGVIRAGLGLIRAGFLVNFLSNPVLAGFINAAALMIAASQAGHLLGLEMDRNDTFITQALAAVQSLGTFHLATAILGIASVSALLYFQRYAGRHLQQFGLSETTAALLARTGPLVTAGAATFAVWILSLDSGYGVDVVGEVPSGLPGVTVPEFDPGYMQALLPAAFVISLVGFMESISIAKSLASRDRESIDANQELVAVGVANLGSAFTGGYTVTGSFSRSVLNDRAGATSGIASIVTALIVLLSVFVLTPLFAYLPRATLSAIVIMAVGTLLETQTFRRVWSYRRSDALTLVITFVAVLVLGIELGLLAGVVGSIALYLWRTSRPSIVELGRVEGSRIYRNVANYTTERDPRILLLRVDESLYFANTQHLQEVVSNTIGERPEVEHLVLVGTAVNDIDASAVETLETLTLQLRASGVSVHLAGFKLIVVDELKHTWLLKLIGSRRIHTTVEDAVQRIESGDVEPDGLDEPADSQEVAPSRVED